MENEKPAARVRLNAADRRAMIVNTARKLTNERDSQFAWTLQDVADACPAPTSRETVKRYFPTVAELREVVGPPTASCVKETSHLPPPPSRT
jgi:hypothetical protein